MSTPPEVRDVGLSAALLAEIRLLHGHLGELYAINTATKGLIADIFSTYSRMLSEVANYSNHMEDICNVAQETQKKID